MTVVTFVEFFGGVGRTVAAFVGAGVAGGVFIFGTRWAFDTFLSSMFKAGK